MKHLRIIALAVVMVFVSYCPYVNTAHAQEHVMQEDVSAIFSRFQEEILSSPTPLLRFDGIRHDDLFKEYWLNFYDMSRPQFQGDFSYENSIINGSVSRSFTVTFPSNYYYEFLLDFVTALIKAIDPNMSAADVQSSANELVLSFSGDYHNVLPSRLGFSKIVTVGDYLLVIRSFISIYASSDIFVNYKNDINVPVDKSQYSNLSFQEIKSNKYPLLKIYLTGIAEEQLPDTNETLPKSCVLFTSSGNQYKVLYCPYYLPIHFEVGKEYTIYGCVANNQEGDYASVIIDYVEMENDAH